MCLNSYWLQMYLRSLGLLFMRSLMLRILLCIPRCFHLLHDGTMNFSSGLDTAPWHHSSWTGLPFLLGGWKVLHQWCHCTCHIILHFEMSSLVLWNKFRPSLLAGDYVCDLSYKSNAFAWLETFHKENSYWQILMHKYMIMQLLKPIQHSSISHWNFLDAFHLYQDNIEIVH